MLMLMLMIMIIALAPGNYPLISFLYDISPGTYGLEPRLANHHLYTSTVLSIFLCR